MMKKLAAVLLLMWLALSCASAETADVAIDLPGLQACFALPQDWACLTRDTSMSVYNQLGMSQREVEPYMEENDIYALIFDMETGVELQLVIYEWPAADCDTLADEDMAFLRDMIREDMTHAGYDVLDCRIYEGAHRFVRTNAVWTDPDGLTEPMIVYSTDRLGYVVELYAFPWEGEVDEALIAQADAVADSLRLTLPEGCAAICMDGITVRFQLPDGMALLTSEQAVEACELPRDYEALRRSGFMQGELQGLIVGPDAAWEICWSLLEGESGDLDLLTDEAAERHAKDTGIRYMEDGRAVENSETRWLGEHRYTHITYSTVDARDGSLTCADEHYTRQNGWNVVVCLYSYGEAAPAEIMAALEEMIRTTRITTIE